MQEAAVVYREARNSTPRADNAGDRIMKKAMGTCRDLQIRFPALLTLEQCRPSRLTPPGAPQAKTTDICPASGPVAHPFWV